MKWNCWKNWSSSWTEIRVNSCLRFTKSMATLTSKISNLTKESCNLRKYRNLQSSTIAKKTLPSWSTFTNKSNCNSATMWEQSQRVWKTQITWLNFLEKFLKKKKLNLIEFLLWVRYLRRRWEQNVFRKQLKPWRRSSKYTNGRLRHL